MTAENVNKVLNNYKGRIPRHSEESVKSSLEVLPDECTSNLMHVSMKSRVAVLLFSIFFGGLSVDRFYLGDNILGIAKLSFSLLIVGLRLMIFFIVNPTMEIVAIITNILNVVLMIWCLADIYYTYQAAKVYNLSRLSYAISLMGKDAQL